MSLTRGWWWACGATVCACAMSASGCHEAPGEGEPCRWESSSDFGGTAHVECASGLECDRTLCLPVDGPEAPRRFGAFEALYEPRASSPTRIWETEGAGAPFVVLDADRLILGGPEVYLLDVSARTGRTLTDAVRGDVEALAHTRDEVWAMGRIEVAVGLALPSFERIVTGYHPGLPPGYLVAGDEAGDLAWVAVDGTAVSRTTFLFVGNRESAAQSFETGPATHLVVEPGGAILILADGHVSSPNGRATPDEALAGLARPLGGPTLGWIDVNDANSPTDVVVVEQDGTLTPLLTLPVELDTVMRLDAFAGRLYVATEWGLFVSTDPIRGLAP